MATTPAKTLALDLGSQFVGWARGLPGERPEYGTHRLPEVAQDDIATLMVDLRSLLRRLSQDVDLVCYEAPIVNLGRMNNPYTTRKVDALGGMVELYCHDAGLRCSEAALGSIRKHFLGRGMTPKKTADIKAAVMSRCRQLGLAVKTNHEADAIACLDYTISMRGADMRFFAQ